MQRPTPPPAREPGRADDSPETSIIPRDEPDGRMPGSAIPFADATAAATSTLEMLESVGLGAWEIVDARLDDLSDVEHLLVPILLPDGALWALRAAAPHPPTLAAGALDAVLYAARMLSSLFAAHHQSDHWRARAVKAETESLTDELTGLLNARGWQRALQRESARCDRSQLNAVIVVIDLDELKLTNDTQGHLGGDLLLRSAAQQLTSALRATDIVARIGGDEFGVLAVDYEAPVPDLLLGRLRSVLASSDVRASCGAAVYRPGDDVNRVFRSADEQMYAAKRTARTATGRS
jgi:diguanylate cyclase (GGDEF)-like protein